MPNRPTLAAVEVEPFALDTIASLSRALEVYTPPIHLAGVHSCAAFALLLSQTHDGRMIKNPHVIVTPDHETAELFAASLEFFDPLRAVHLLPAFDVDPYSGLYPNPRAIASRLNWLYHAAHATCGEIFVASVEAVMQKTLPFQVFNSFIRTIERTSELPKNFAAYLLAIGYLAVPTVEDVGTFSVRGGVIDIFSPAHSHPLRLELFGDTVESLRFFDPSTQLSLENSQSTPAGATRASAVILPAREVLYSDENRQAIARALSQPPNEMLRSASLGQPFYGMDYLVPLFYETPGAPLEYFSSPIDFWIFHEIETARAADEVLARLKKGFNESSSTLFRVPVESLYTEYEKLELAPDSTRIHVNRAAVGQDNEAPPVELSSFSLQEFAASTQPLVTALDQLTQYLQTKFQEWQRLGYRIFVVCPKYLHRARKRRALAANEMIRAVGAPQARVLLSEPVVQGFAPTCTFRYPW